MNFKEFNKIFIIVEIGNNHEELFQVACKLLEKIIFKFKN